MNAAHLKEKLQVLSEFSRRMSLRSDVENRIKRFLENNHHEQLHQLGQNRLLDALPANLRTQVVSHTHGEIVKKIRFFDDKPADFIWNILPLFSQMKVYKKDILYGQLDQPEEIFFIIKGRVKFYYNKNFRACALDSEAKPDMIPINMHVQGSYFGDNDVLINKGKSGRDSTALAQAEC